MKQLLLAFLLVSTNAFAQENTDSSAIVQLLIKDYKTLGNWDIKSHTANCTANYLLIENAEVWDLKKEAEYFAANAHRILDRKDFFTIHYVRVYGDVAYAVYHLKSDITEKGKLKVKTWLESSIFRKIKGEWKIELINSTPVELKQ